VLRRRVLHGSLRPVSDQIMALSKKPRHREASDFRALNLPAFACGFQALWFAAGTAAAEQPLTIERLITDGWDVADYVWAGANRSLIPFKHKNYKSFVQCSVLVDVTRHPAVVTACYEIK